MKYIFPALLVLALVFSCSNCTEDPDTGGTGGTGGTTPPPPSAQNCYSGLDTLEKKVFDILAKDYWVVTGFHKIGDKGASKTQKGRWYQFLSDCTFTVGHFDKVISTGTWSLEANATHVRLDAEQMIEDGLWRMQIKTDGSMMVFVGTEQYQTNSIQQRLENLMFAPKNPKEMGWEQ